MKTIHTKMMGLGLVLAAVAAVAVVVPKGNEPPVRAARDGVAARSRPEAWPTRSGSVLPRSGERQEIERGRQSPNIDAERVRLRTAALAEKLELSAGDKEALLAVLLEEQSRRTNALRGLRGTTAHEAEARTELTAILAWKTEALRTRFGSDLAEAMMRR